MTPDRYIHIFTRTEPWASLGLFRRVARICRVAFGCILFGSLVLVALLTVRNSAKDLSLIVVVPMAALFAWAIGCMFIWRAVHSPSQPSSDGSRPPEPPTEGAPRTAPLRPFSPLVQSVHAELPNERRG
jgi:hypothetical protein